LTLTPLRALGARWFHAGLQIVSRGER
jgi:hypothetical protein